MSASSLRAARFALFAAALLLPNAARSQSLPIPPGNNGYYVFVERAGTGSDVLTIHNPDFALFAGVNGTTQVALTGQLSATHNRRAAQTRLEVLPTLAFDGVDPVPHVLVPTVSVVAGVTTLNVEAAHFALTTASVCGPNGASCAVALATGAANRFDYDILPITSNGTVFVEFSNGQTGAAAQTTVVQLQLFPGVAPVVLNQFTFNQAPTPFATRMTFDSASNGVVVPLLNGVVSINVTTGVASTIVQTPALGGGGFGPRYIVGTNLALGFNSIAGQSVVFGLSRPGGVSGHSWGAYNPATNFATFGANDPFGVGRSLAPGFNEPAVSTVGGAAVAVLLTATPSVVGGGTPGAGAVGLLSATGATNITATTSALTTGGAPLGAFGNPEVLRPTAGNVASLLAANPANGQQFVAAVGLGGGVALGSLAVSAPLAGAVDVQATDRPWNLPGGNNYVVADSVASAMLTFTITAGAGVPTITLSASAPVSGQSSSAVNIFSGPSVPLGLANVPAAIGAFSDGLNAGQDIAAVGAPLALAGFTLSFVDPLPAAPYNASGPLAFVWTPPAASSVALFGARTPVFNVTSALGALPVAPSFAYPASLAGSTLVVLFQGGYYGAAQFYASGLVIASEIASF